MSTERVSWPRVTQNIISLGLRELLNKGTYLILGIAIARNMGQQAFGSYTLSLLLSRGFFTIGDLGMSTWLIREVAQHRENAGRYFGTIGVYRILTGIVALFLLKGFLAVSDYPSTLKALVFFSGLAFFFLHLTSFIFSFFRAFEKMENELEVSVLKNVLWVGLGLWAVFQGSLVVFFKVFIGTSLFAFVYALIVYIQRIGFKEVRWMIIPLRGLMPIWSIQSIVMVYLYMGTVLLSFFRTVSEVGLYQAAYSFMEILLVASSILTIALFPVFSRLARTSQEQLVAFYEEAFRAILFFFAPCGILALFGAKTLLELFYGTSFRPALPALYLLFSGAVFFIFGGMNSHLLVAMGKERRVLLITILCTLLNLVLSVLLIPRFGFLGASCALLASEAAVFSLMVGSIVQAFRSHRFLQGGPFLWIIMGWCLFLLCLMRFSFWIQLFLGASSYVLLSFVFHQTLTKELHAVKVIWKELQERS